MLTLSILKSPDSVEKNSLLNELMKEIYTCLYFVLTDLKKNRRKT